jgi:hypothetical protein
VNDVNLNINAKCISQSYQLFRFQRRDWGKDFRGERTPGERKTFDQKKAAEEREKAKEKEKEKENSGEKKEPEGGCHD